MKNNGDELSEDDDAEYYKQELGEKPEKNIIQDTEKYLKSFKKRKYENSDNIDSYANVSNKKKDKMISFDKNDDAKTIKKPVFFRFSAKKKQMFKSK